MATQRGETQILTIADGPLGPIEPTSLSIAPFTVLCGKQGTGKSLVSQVLYLFNHLPYLIPYYAARLRQLKEVAAPPGVLLEECFKNLRGANRRFAPFLAERLRLSWQASAGAEELAIGVFRQQGKHPAANEALQRRLHEIQTSGEARQHAIFVPTERLLYSQGSGPSTWHLLRLPVTLQFFADAMERAGQTVAGWDGGVPDTEEGRWVMAVGARALAGSVRRQQDTWLWTLAQGRRQVSLPIDMASSGQRANWPLVLLAQVLFSWRAGGELAEPFSLYVEEPEIHLHPEAQVAMVHILAFLVNHGFRVVVTTHSLTILYALNNLVLASGVGAEAPGLPELAVRLRPEQIAAYVLNPDGSKTDMVEPETGFLSEAELGEVSATLGDQLNQISLLRGGGG